MSNGGFSFKIRTQFSFIVDDRTLSCILSGIAKQNINITGYMQTKLFKTNNSKSLKYNIVRLVVGSSDSESGNDLQGTRDVLDSLGVSFQEKFTIQIVDVMPGIPGAFNGIFGALWCKVAVNAFYIGENNRFFIDASDICEALLTLSQSPLRECPKQCKPYSGIDMNISHSDWSLLD